MNHKLVRLLHALHMNGLRKRHLALQAAYAAGFCTFIQCLKQKHAADYDLVRFYFCLLDTGHSFTVDQLYHIRLIIRQVYIIFYGQLY